MQFKIESDVQVPSGRQKIPFPFEAMKVNDSFEIDKSMASRARYAIKMYHDEKNYRLNPETKQMDKLVDNPVKYKVCSMGSNKFRVFRLK